MLRMPSKFADPERQSRVNDIVLQLALINCRATPIGRLSGGEKKRLAFATALLTNPSVVLVDEPTSGLDTYLAKSLMSIIRSMAVKRNQAIIVVLHQPTSTIFNLVDKLCLLAEGGQQAFFGTKNEAQEFFVTRCLLLSLSLDRCIERLSAPSDVAGDKGVVAQQLAVEQYIKSEYLISLNTTIKNHLESTNNNEITNNLEEIECSPFGRQLKWLLWRSMVSVKHNPRQTTKLFLRLVIMALVLGIAYFRSNPSASNYIGYVNGLILLLPMPLIESNMSLLVVQIINERAVVIWDHRRKLYSTGAYYLSRLIFDTCFLVIICTFYTSIVVVMTGLSHWILLVGASILLTITACALAAFIAALASTHQAVLLVVSPIVMISANFSGYFINLHAVPIYMSWLKYLSFSYYGFSLLLISEWHHIHISFPCRASVSSSQFTKNTTLSNMNTCTAMGKDILHCFDIDDSSVQNNIVGLVLLLVAFHIGAFTISYVRIRRSI